MPERRKNVKRKGGGFPQNRISVFPVPLFWLDRRTNLVYIGRKSGSRFGTSLGEIMKNRSAGLFVVCAAVCAVVLVSCSSVETREPLFTDISGDWILSAIEYDASQYDGYDGAGEFLASLEQDRNSLGVIFSADRSGEQDFVVYGFAGVNSYNGFLSFAGEPLLVNPPAATLVAGPPDAERFESLFLQELYHISRAELSPDGSSLVLSGSGDSGMTFRRFRLAETSWHLTALHTGSAVVTLSSFVDVPVLTFGEGGTLSGSTGVNRLTGSWSEGDEARGLVLQQVAATRMAAPDAERAALEADFLALLAGTAGYRISASSLTLCSADGTTLLVFSPAK